MAVLPQCVVSGVAASTMVNLLKRSRIGQHREVSGSVSIYIARYRDGFQHPNIGSGSQTNTHTTIFQVSLL